MKMLVQNPKYSRIALGLPGVLILIWAILAVTQQSVFYYAVAIVLVVGGAMIIKGFGVDRSAKDFYKWAREYQPPSLPRQIANYATIAGILCVAISVYSGYINTASAVNALVPPLTDAGSWLSAMPKLSGFYIKGAIDLIVVGLATVLFGRAIRLYFDHDARVLRNAALIVSIGWTRQIFDGAADVLISEATGFGSYEYLIYAIIVGILIAIASVLVILIIHRQAKSFFAESKTKVDEFGESS
jgi:uncharacterized membrane protein